MKQLLYTFILCLSITSFGQGNEFNLIELDSTWGKEVLRFPARNMSYIGVGEVRFPPEGWIKPKHPNFWSYTYAWEIDVNRKIEDKELAADLVKYFNSLNRIEMHDTDNPKKTSATVVQTKIKNTTTFFEGKVFSFDRFATNKRFVLNVKIESNFCEQAKKTVLLFKFSPKEFNHETWKMLDKIELIKDFCN